MEDKLLIWKLSRGSQRALCRIYDKYRDDLVRIAAGLLNDVSAAEDVVQDVFLMLVRSAHKYEIRKSLKGYLTSCVVNKARNSFRSNRSHERVSLDDVVPPTSGSGTPDRRVECDEEFESLYNAVAQLPYEQKEVVILHIQAKMKFRQIARLQQVPLKTALSRYRYGLNKLRAMLNSEVKK